MKRTAAAVLAGLAVISVGASASAGTQKRAIESAGNVAITDYDGHPHRTSPKHVGENLNIWCRSTGESAKRIEVATFFETRPVAQTTIECPTREFPRAHTIYTAREPGVYGMVLNGAGFDGFVIRTTVRRGAGEEQPPPVPCENCPPPPVELDTSSGSTP
jgi:hypothetical protein